MLPRILENPVLSQFKLPIGKKKKKGERFIYRCCLFFRCSL